MSPHFIGLVRHGVIEHRKGDLVMARLDGPRWWASSVGLVLHCSEGSSASAATITAVLESGVHVSLGAAAFDHWFMTFPCRDESMFVMCYGLASQWQVEEDFHAGRFEEAFVKARQSASAVMAARRSGMQNHRTG